ncbi:MAG TPA: hypothetical protein VNS63_18575 [Blastocatellia bacterium]|nr:hypothetical protein [Blastocatellia bacterium]
MRAYVVWLPIFGGDFRGEARKLSNSFSDKRVSYFVDAKSETGKLWEGVLRTDRFIAWDVYMLYTAAANWQEEPPQPAFWMHQLGGVTKAPTFDEATFTAKLKELLGDMKASPTASQANGRARVEFLYFNSCPGYKQALANLKGALQESKISADLVLINVASEEQAAKVGFQGSPSIRVNGKDLDGRNEGHSYGCRIYQIGGRITATPTREFIREKLSGLQLGRPGSSIRQRNASQ